MSEAFAREDLSHWRVGGYGGAPMPEATIDRARRALPGSPAQRLRRHRDHLAGTLMPHGPA
jgi:hypothetical protein